MQIVDVTSMEDHLVIDISGNKSRFHFLWLRDNCPGSRSPNGQRLHESNAIDARIRPACVSHDGHELRVVWSDAAESYYPVEYLSALAYDNARETPGKIVLWNGRIGGQIRRHDYGDVRTDDRSRRTWLEDVERYGFSLLQKVPPVEETILDVVALFGFVRETNYGRLFDVRTQEKPSNLAYTPVPLSVHTDNPYRDPPPTLQLLHCLRQADEGGITALVDGFHAAERLRREDRKAFDLLTGNAVSFRYESEGAILESTDRIISLDAAGRIKSIRINNRSMAPLKLDFELVMPFYRALFRFRRILEDEDAQYRFRMEPGYLVVLDNERVLHGRVRESIGERHLQGCYADRDGLISTLRILECRGD